MHHTTVRDIITVYVIYRELLKSLETLGFLQDRCRTYCDSVLIKECFGLSIISCILRIYENPIGSRFNWITVASWQILEKKFMCRILRFHYITFYQCINATYQMIKQFWLIRKNAWQDKPTSLCMHGMNNIL